MKTYEIIHALTYAFGKCTFSDLVMASPTRDVAVLVGELGNNSMFLNDDDGAINTLIPAPEDMHRVWEQGEEKAGDIVTSGYIINVPIQHEPSPEFASILRQATNFDTVNDITTYFIEPEIAEQYIDNANYYGDIQSYLKDNWAQWPKKPNKKPKMFDL